MVNNKITNTAPFTYGSDPFGETTISVTENGLSTTVSKVEEYANSAGSYPYTKQENVWIDRGLTSSNVQFDYAYYNENVNVVIGFICRPKGSSRPGSWPRRAPSEGAAAFPL